MLTIVIREHKFLYLEDYGQQNKSINILLCIRLYIIKQYKQDIFMEDNFVNELLTRIEVLTAENTEKDNRIEAFIEQVAKLERDNSDLLTQNDNLRALIKQRVESTDSLNE